MNANWGALRTLPHALPHVLPRTAHRYVQSAKTKDKLDRRSGKPGGMRLLSPNTASHGGSVNADGTGPSPAAASALAKWASEKRLVSALPKIQALWRGCAIRKATDYGRGVPSVIVQGRVTSPTTISLVTPPAMDQGCVTLLVSLNESNFEFMSDAVLSRGVACKQTTYEYCAPVLISSVEPAGNLLTTDMLWVCGSTVDEPMPLFECGEADHEKVVVRFRLPKSDHEQLPDGEDTDAESVAETSKAVDGGDGKEEEARGNGKGQKTTATVLGDATTAPMTVAGVEAVLNEALDLSGDDGLSQIVTVPGILRNPNQVQCASPPHVPPDTNAMVSLSLNGQDFSNEVAIKIRNNPTLNELEPSW